MNEAETDTHSKLELSDDWTEASKDYASYLSVDASKEV